MNVLNKERRTWPSAAPFHVRTLALLFGLLISALRAHSAAADMAPFMLQWHTNAATGGWSLNVAITNVKTLAELHASPRTLEAWQKLLAVHAEPGGLLGSVGMPAMLGTYHIHAGAIQFEPQFPLEPGLRYVASFYPAQLPGTNGGPSITSTLVLPRRAPNASTVVAQIYPTANVLPENLLKFYIHFSAPMSRGHIYEHIHLRDAAGKDVELPFLEIDEELWDPEMTRLTLFIDPGRIKRGVTPLEEIGPALEQGKRYTLTIARTWTDANGSPLKEDFIKRFAVSSPDRTPIDPGSWRIQPAAAGTRAPLVIAFGKPLDHALAQRLLHVADSAGQPVIGERALEDQERRWKFTPARPWNRGAHAVLVESTMEDLAGNNIGKPFDVDLSEKVEPRLNQSTVKIPFEVH